MKKIYFEDENRVDIRLKYAFIGTFLFSLAANAFSYFNFYPQHDAVNHSLSFAGSWEVSLGRFLLPLYGQIRGNVTVPWVTGLLSIIFISISVFLITDLLEIKKPVYIIAVSSFLSANLSLVDLLGVFTYVADSYMLSFLCACAGVYCVRKINGFYGILAGALFFFASFGLYQAFISTIVCLYIALLSKDLMNKEHFVKDCVPRYIKYCISVLLGLIMYYLGYKLSLDLWNTSPADSYNSLSSLLGLSFGEIIKYLIINYLGFINTFFGKDTVIGGVTQYFNMVLAIISTILLINRFVETKFSTFNLCIIILLIVVFPVGSLLTNILMLKSNIGFYVSYSMFLIYPFLIVFISDCAFEGKRKWIHLIVITCFVMLQFSNILYSNGAFTTQKILYDRGISNVTQILGDIESDSKYVYGETPVIMIGSFSSNNYLTNITSDYGPLSGYYKSSVTYSMTFRSMANLLGHKVVLESDETIINQYKDLPEVQEMAIFPNYGYYQMIDDVMIVRLSEK